jgi:hypothetical protein
MRVLRLRQAAFATYGDFENLASIVDSFLLGRKSSGS